MLTVADEKKREELGFCDFAGLDAARADERTLDRAFELDLDALQVGIKAAQGFPDDLGTGTAGSFDRTASFVFVSGHGPLIADNANSHSVHLE